jgi:TolB-like protein/DNA-binding winged helix-turn-helix (wHTH) protein
MDARMTADFLLFEGFCLDRCGGRLFRQDERGVFEPLLIGSRALEVLGVLVERRGDLVGKGELMDAVWPGMAIGDNNLAVQISTLRRILDCGRSEGSCIRTVTGRGYRFVASVTQRPKGGDASDATGGARSSAMTAPIPGDGEIKEPTRKRRLWRGIPARLIALAGTGFAVATDHRWFGGNAVAPRLSIVVLPFANLSGDAEQQYFADGITEDLTTDLSRIAGMFVISGNTAFTYRNRPVDTKQIGRELGVRYVLEGSVRRAGGATRINAQLIDVETDAHLWAERFERDTADLFALQNEVTSRIAVALGSELVIAAAARPTDDPDALDYILRGRAVMSNPLSPDNYAEAIGLFERALAVDPRSTDALSWLAIAIARRVLDQMSDTPAADIAIVEGLVVRALAVSPRSPIAHFAKGDLLCALRRFAEAIPEYEIVLSSDRNSAHALAVIGRLKISTGMIDEAIPLVEQAIRLSPRDPYISVWYYWIAEAHLLQSRTDEAIFWLEKARNANPELSYVHVYLASAYALKGESEYAAAELAEAHRLVGDDRYASIAGVKAYGYWVPKVNALAETTLLAGLRTAGVPEV